MKPKRFVCRCLLLASIAVSASITSLFGIPVFPGATGFGTQTAAGRNGTIIRVTNLNNSGAGSLREALTSTVTPRVVIFNVSGIIQLTSHITISTGGVTVAGQTAPSPGIIVKGASIIANASNILIQHIAVRPGNENPTTPSLVNRDAFGIDSYNKSAGISNVVLDHVSGSWSTDEVISLWAGGSVDEGTQGGPVQNVTISNSILAEALARSGRTDSNANYPTASTKGHSAGLLIGKGANQVSVVRNVFAWCDFRNPYCNTDSNNIQVVNNFVYSPGGGQNGNKMNFGPNTGPMTVTAKGNWTYLRPDTNPDEHVSVGGNTAHAMKLFQDQNKVFNLAGGTWTSINDDPWHSSVTTLIGRTLADVRLTSESPIFTALNVPYKTTNIKVETLARAGARPLDRDPVDTRVVNEINANNMKAFLDNSGTYPAWGIVTRVLTPPANLPSDENGNGYTNLEDWLHGISAELESKISGGFDTDILTAGTFDTFSDGNALGWRPVGITHWTVTGGVYRQNDNYGGARAVMTGTNWTNQVVEAKVKVGSFAEADRFVAVYARFQDMKNGYYVALRNVGTGAVDLKKVVGGTPTVLQTLPFPINTTSTYKVRLVASGTSISAVVTNLTTGTSVTLPTTTDNSLASGSAAIGTYRATADFDDVFASPDVSSVPVLTDDFDDGNSTGWDTTWTGMAGTWSVVADGSNGLRQSSTAASVGARAIAPELTNLPTANQSVQADVKPLAFNGSGFVGLYARFVSPNETYYLILRDNRVLELKKLLPTGQTPIAMKTLPLTFTVAAWHTLRMTVTGTSPVTLKAYVDGVEELSGSDISATIVSPAKAGVGTFSASAHFDDIVITSP